jgi:hypothetical protein
VTLVLHCKLLFLDKKKKKVRFFLFLSILLHKQVINPPIFNMSDAETDKNPVASKRARDSSLEDEPERASKIDPKDQVKIIEQNHLDGQEEGTYWYLIHKAWYMRWKQYCSRISSSQQDIVNIAKQSPPGPINNAPLLKDGKLIPDLEVGESVFAVPEKGWENLVEW